MLPVLPAFPWRCAELDWDIVLTAMVPTKPLNTSRAAQPNSSTEFQRQHLCHNSPLPPAPAPTLAAAASLPLLPTASPPSAAATDSRQVNASAIAPGRASHVEIPV